MFNHFLWKSLRRLRAHLWFEQGLAVVDGHMFAVGGEFDVHGKAAIILHLPLQGVVELEAGYTLPLQGLFDVIDLFNVGGYFVDACFARLITLPMRVETFTAVEALILQLI